MNRYRIVWTADEWRWVVFDGLKPVKAFARLLDAENFVTRGCPPQDCDPGMLGAS